MGKEYCGIYSKLVNGDGDMIGHIAYSLYKSEKVHYINDYKVKYGTDVVPDKEIKAFTTGRETKKCIEHYRGMAESILQDFIGVSFDEMSEQVIAEVTGRLTKHLDEKVIPRLPKKDTWWGRYGVGVLQSMFGTFLMAFVVWGIVSVVNKHRIEDIFPPQNSIRPVERVSQPSTASDSIAGSALPPLAK